MSKMDDKQKQTIKDLLETQKITRIGTWRLDLATSRVVWSEGLYRISERDSSLLAPSPSDHMKLFTSESWQRLSEAHENAITHGVPYDLELETVKPDGSHGWVWVQAEAEKDESDNIVSIFVVAQDITGHKRIEEELRRSEERFQLLFDKAPLGYQSLDVNGFFLEVNQKWLDTLGFTREEVLGKWFGDFLCPEYVDGFRDRFPIFKAQGFIHSEFEMLSKSGQRLFIAFDGKIGYSLNGDFRQTHCILQDITKQKAAERAVQAVWNALNVCLITRVSESGPSHPKVFWSPSIKKQLNIWAGNPKISSACQCEISSRRKNPRSTFRALRKPFALSPHWNTRTAWI